MAGPMDLRPPRSGVSHPFRGARPCAMRRWVSQISRKPGRAGAYASLGCPPARHPRANQKTRGGDADIGLHRAFSNRSIVPAPGPRTKSKPQCPFARAHETPLASHEQLHSQRQFGKWHAKTTKLRDPSQLARVPQSVAPVVALDHLTILVTRPAPTVRPPSRMANLSPSSMAMG